MQPSLIQNEITPSVLHFVFMQLSLIQNEITPSILHFVFIESHSE
jgi:hypothetical protein